MRDTNYFTIQYWMVSKLKLKGVERDVYAIIYGFTQDNDTECKCSLNWMSELTGHTKKSVAEAINNLESANLIVRINSTSNSDRRNSYKCNYDIIDNLDGVERTPSWCRENTLDGVEGTPHNKDNKININKSTGAGALSKNHSQIYKKKETLNDDLCSGKDIDEQTKVRKKESKYDKCLVEIDKRDFSDEEKLLLREHIQWSFNSADPNRNNEPRKYAKRLDELLKLKGDRLQIIQQSIEKQWHCFYEYKETSNTRTYETKQDKIKIRDLEEAKAAMKKKDEEGVEVF